MSDRIAVMLDGKIAQLASPQELYSRPVSKWVASFIGVMNFLQGDLFRDGGDKLSVDAGILGKISLNQEQIPVPVATGPVTIGIRPEMLTVLYDKNSTAEFELNAVIMESDYYGDMTYYTVKVEQSELVLIVSMRNTAGRTVLKEGDKARIGWGSESLVILAESTSSE
jgi:spermidine/putrescine transport system ATP-binding protein